MTTDIAVLIARYNEEATIRCIVADCSRALDGTGIRVGDHASSDASGRIARWAGTEVIRVRVSGFMLDTLVKLQRKSFEVNLMLQERPPSERP